MKNCPFSRIRMGVAHSCIWNPGWLCILSSPSEIMSHFILSSFWFLKKKSTEQVSDVAREWHSSPHLSIPLRADTSPSALLCEAVVAEGLRGTAVHSKDSSPHGDSIWGGGSTQVVSVQRRPRPGIGPSTSWQMDVPWGCWAPWLWSWCWCAGEWGWPESHTQPPASGLVPQGRDLENPPSLFAKWKWKHPSKPPHLHC